MRHCGRTNKAAIDQWMMARCVELGRDGAKQGEYLFGSLIAIGGAVIAEANNHANREQDELRHAEIIAIAEAHRLGKRPLRECTLYSAVEPCPMCSFCIRSAGIGRVVFALASPIMGGMSRWDILGDSTMALRFRFLFGAVPEIVSGVGAEDAQKLWSHWNPIAWQAIKRLGFFVSPRLSEPASPARELGEASERTV
jgi:tRNA(adenine34) deaminase